jgi:hypothetical protein
MKNSRFHYCAAIVVALMVMLSLLLWAADAWKTKNYTEWSEADANQVLNRSPWANTESVATGFSGIPEHETEAVGSVSRPSGLGGADDMNSINYTVAWYSSAPVRQAHARLASLKGKATEDQLKQFLEPVADVCLITVAGGNRKPFIEANKEKLLKKTYLQVKGKEKIYATEFAAPTATSRLAVFQFPRTVNGAPIFVEADKDVEFVTDVGAFKIRSHFTPQKMIFNGAFTF